MPPTLKFFWSVLDAALNESPVRYQSGYGVTSSAGDTRTLSVPCLSLKSTALANIRRWNGSTPIRTPT